MHAPLPNLCDADSVLLTFELHKNQEKFDTVTHRATGHKFLCPVKQWAAVVNHVWSYPGATADTPVLAVWRYDRIEHLTSQTLIAALCDAVVAVGKDSLGFKASEVGTHSIRSGAAMQMYLDNLPIWPRARKLNYAIVGDDDHPASVDVFYISPAVLKKHGLPDWLRGAPSAGYGLPAL